VLFVCGGYGWSLRLVVWVLLFALVVLAGRCGWVGGLCGSCCVLLISFLCRFGIGWLVFVFVACGVFPVSVGFLVFEVGLVVVWLGYRLGWCVSCCGVVSVLVTVMLFVW